MKPRDALLVAAVVAVIGFAAADALTNRDEGPPVRFESREATTSTRAEAPPAPFVTKTVSIAAPGFPGRLVFTDDQCYVGEVDLAGPTETVRGPFGRGCGLWGPALSDRLAFGASELEADVASYAFRVADLGSRQTFGPYPSRWEDEPVWSADGSRVAWCAPGERGFELRVGGRPRRLQDCADAFTTKGRPVFIEGHDLLVDGHRILSVPVPINRVAFAQNGSVLVLGLRNLAYRYAALGRAPTVETIGPYFPPPALSADNCAAALLSPRNGQQPMVRLVDLGCAPRLDERAAFSGDHARFSPDGRWIAVGDLTGITIYSTRARASAVARLPVGNKQLLWKE